MANCIVYKSEKFAILFIKIANTNNFVYRSTMKDELERNKKTTT